MTELVVPAERYRASFLVAAAEFAAEGAPLGVTAATFSAFLQRLADYAADRNLKPGHVPESTYWLVDGDEYLGRISLRHALTDELRLVGGHVGYAVRPSRRREGHATRMLMLALPKLAALGIDPALVTCDDDNVGSRRVIEACGGRLATDRVPGSCRYWLATSERQAK